MSSRYRPDIDGLRAVALVLVLMFHAFPSWVPGAFAGVDVFFVISGYLIGGLVLGELEHGSFRFRRFYARRIRRLFPALIVVMLAVFVFGWRNLLPRELMMLGKDLMASALFAANVGLLVEAGYFDRETALKPLVHLWSLGIEEQFYIVWPVLLLMLTKLARRLLVPVLSAIALLSFVYSAWLAFTHQDHIAFCSPFARCWEPAAGTILARVVRPGERASSALSAAGLALIAGGAFLLSSKSGLTAVWLAAPVFGAALFIAGGPTAWPNRFLSRKPFVAIGLISYSTYLWHWPLFSCFRILIGAEPAVIERIGLVLLSFVLGALTYALIENPVRRAKPGAAIAIPALAMAAVAALGAYALVTSGVPWRFPQLIRDVTAAQFKVQDQYRTGRCFAMQTQNETAFSAECLETKRPLVFIWGDSQAAGLYPGLRVLQGLYHYGIAQMTATACAPMLGVENPRRPFCKQINDHVFQVIEQTKPNMVLLEAGWFFEGHEAEYGQAYNGQLLTQTVSELKRIGVEHIVLMGGAPNWPEGGVRRALYDAWRNDPFNPELPLRLVPKNWEAIRRSDAETRATAAGLGVEFISVVEVMCNDDGCLTRVGNQGKDITSADSFHLTPAASVFLINRLFETGQLAAIRKEARVP